MPPTPSAHNNGPSVPSTRASMASSVKAGPRNEPDIPSGLCGVRQTAKATALGGPMPRGQRRPSAPPAVAHWRVGSEGLNGPSRSSLPLATQFSATPPARQRFLFPVIACARQASQAWPPPHDLDGTGEIQIASLQRGLGFRGSPQTGRESGRWSRWSLGERVEAVHPPVAMNRPPAGPQVHCGSGRRGGFPVGREPHELGTPPN